MYGRILTKNNNFIGSKWIHKNNDWSRVNYNVRVSMQKFKNYIKSKIIY